MNEELLLTGSERVKIYQEYMKKQPDKIEPECEFAYLQMMLKAQLVKAKLITEKQIFDRIIEYGREHRDEQLAWVLDTEGFWQALKGKK